MFSRHSGRKGQRDRSLAGRGYVWVLALAACLAFQPAMAETRVALIVGNGDYIGQPQLPNPPHDAQDMSAVLESLGFKVITGVNVNKADFDGKLHEFARSTTDADVALFYYSGHGMQIDGVNYLIPIDAPLTKADVDFQTVTLDFVQKVLDHAKTKIVMLDACRNNPFAAALGEAMGTRAINANAGLALATAPDLGYFIAFATQPGHVASDGTGRNSPFTGSLKDHIADPGVSISDLMIAVRNDVAQATNGQQIPWDHSALAARFYFKEGEAAEPAGADRKSSEAAEAWGWVRDTSNPASLQQFITLYGDTPFAGKAKVRLAALETESGTRSATVPAPSAMPAPSAGSIALGASKPSFDCRTNHTEAEVTVCNKPELSALDNEMNRLYTQSLKAFSETKGKALIAQQRLWLKARNDCATGIECLAGKYREQIKKLKASAPTVASAGSQIQPSFDCNTRTLPAEVAVCANTELAQLDLDMDRLYTQQLKTAKGTPRQALVAGQRHWVRNRDTCSGSVPCLKVQYKARIERLQQ
ncbi:MAG: caspase family protein [Rhodomicrobium sp.]